MTPLHRDTGTGESKDPEAKIGVLSGRDGEKDFFRRENYK